MLICISIFIALSGLIILKNILLGRFLKNLPTPSLPIITTEITYQNWPIILKQPATIVSKQETKLSAMTQGHLRSILVQPGDDVIADQPLFQLEMNIQQAQHRKALAAFELASMNFERDTKLFDEKTITRSAFNSSMAYYNQALADLNQASTQLEYCTIRAPFSGKLGYFNLAEGNFIQIGQPLTDLYSHPPYDVEFSLPQSFFTMIEPNHEITVKQGNLLKKGHIYIKGHGVSPTNRHFSVRASIPESTELLPGSFAEITLQFDSEQSYFVIPQEAVQYSLLGAFVWVFNPSDQDHKKGTVFSIPVETLRPFNNLIAIQSKQLKEKMLIVLKGQEKLKQDSEVIIYE